MNAARVPVFPASVWRQRFVDSLLKSSPEINPDAADEVSDSQFVVLAALAPEQAAVQYLATQRLRTLSRG
jgi:hypothetical protein